MTIKIIDARYVASATDLAQLPPPQRAEVAFAGRSNVGKSSLINKLVARKKLVRTSGTPGCTRAINIFEVELRPPGQTENALLDLVDLPGYGFARRSKKERMSWGPLMESFMSQRPGLRGVVIIVDVRRGLEDDDRQLIDYLEHIDREPIVVATKLDKVPKARAKLTLKGVQQNSSGAKVHGFSAETGEGRDQIWKTILKTAGIG
ncbi:MAG: ribosome biogenesis GTP-binding protein YihA/YsxC [Polyangiales bacterium]